ncbi:MAG: DUF6015 family protein [Methanomassiliicoccales archaeon]
MKEFDVSRHSSLSRAIAKKVGLEKDAADTLALRVLNYFGFENEVIDNTLDQEDRRLFYFLQDMGLLKTAWEEALLPNGRSWRIFYWYLNTEKIEEFSKDEIIQNEEKELYNTLPAEIWVRDGIKIEES